LSSTFHPFPIEIAPGDPTEEEEEVHPMSQLRRLAIQAMTVAVPVVLVVVAAAGYKFP
jgi:hypothetical protein